MTWYEAQLSLQVISERTVGAPHRRDVYEAKAREDAAAAAAVAALDGPPRR